jgi:hypothetical protein
MTETRRIGARGRPIVGAFFIAMGGVHVGVVGADTETYRHFADQALFGFVRDGWSDVFMAHPAFWGLCLAAGEILLGAFLLIGGRAGRIGWIGVLAFHVLLSLFGFGIWLWCLPALALLGTLAHADWANQPVHSGADGPTRRDLGPLVHGHRGSETDTNKEATR